MHVNNKPIQLTSQYTGSNCRADHKTHFASVPLKPYMNGKA